MSIKLERHAALSRRALERNRTDFILDCLSKPDSSPWLNLEPELARSLRREENWEEYALALGATW